MSRDLLDRQREALRNLARVFAEEARGGLLGEALDAVLEATRIEAGAAFSMDGGFLDLVADRGLGSGPSDKSDHPAPRAVAPRDLAKDLLLEAANKAVANRRQLYIPDLARSDIPPKLHRDLTRRGYRSLAAQPVRHHREMLGVLVFLGKDGAAYSPASLAFFETICHMAAVATERDRRAERELNYRAELVEAGHLATLGLLTATVAHELRGPVAAISVQVAEQQQILDHLQEPLANAIPAMIADFRELLTDMKAATAQMSTLISRLSSFSRRDSSPSKVDLMTAAREGVSIAKSELKRRGVLLHEEYAEGCFTMGRRDNLVQVVLNLLFNAIDACTSIKGRESKITLRTKIDGSRVVLSVDDNGPGVPPTNVHAIFRPFFTTKKRGEGTGLGLKICSDVVASHHGHIEVVNLDGGGASFRVILPRLAGATPSGTTREAAVVSPPEQTEIKRLFVVDDDELFARTLKRALKPHEVTTASSASEAEIALLDPSFCPHLVLCDLGLPGLTGDVLHAHIAAARPLVAKNFVFLTGGACSKQEADYLRASGCATLLKPVDVKDIWAALAGPNPRNSVAPEGVATLRSELPGAGETDGVSNVPTLPPG
ncbi:MAG TPA: ATP-binding protein [Polyangiaceae bacterium]|nr:ATP-binding protein [Polyangiaceae bacterium]